MIRDFDHVNLRTPDLERALDWYARILDMHPGPRPPAFDFPGAWVYAGDKALIHFVGVDKGPEPQEEPPLIEHFAFSASDLAGFLEVLKAEGVEYYTGAVTGPVDVCQINIFDPDGNHIHIDFPGDEARALGLI